MQDDEIRTAIDRAQSLAQDRDEPFRSVAFWVILDNLLKQAATAHTEPGATAVGPAPAKPTQDLPPTMNEFLAIKAPQSHVDRVTAIAYYSLHSGDDAGVTTKEILDAYAQKREKKPQNLPDVIRHCVKKGLMIESQSAKDGAKAWVITSRGEAYVENDFQM